MKSHRRIGLAPIPRSSQKYEKKHMSPEAPICPKFDVLRRQLDLVDAGAKFFSDLFERAPEAMVVIDAKGRVLAANAAACRLYAVDQSELVRLRIHDLLPRELERAHEQRAFGEAAAVVVHDVNNLLVPIFCYTDLLALREPADDELQRGVAEIREAAERAASLARKLLSIAELTNEQPAVVQMNDTLDKMREMLTLLLGARIELSLRFDRALGCINIDKERLERLVLNLVLNARDAMPAGGKLVIETVGALRDVGSSATLGADPSKRYAVLCVTDTGVGMDASTRAHIFEPFFTTKSRAGGTGLGLSMALSFVNRNQGFIDVDSRPGYGTTFRIGFPVFTEFSSG